MNNSPEAGFFKAVIWPFLFAARYNICRVGTISLEKAFAA